MFLCVYVCVCVRDCQSCSRSSVPYRMNQCVSPFTHPRWRDGGCRVRGGKQTRKESVERAFIHPPPINRDNFA